MEMTPIQIITVCGIFVGFHLLALPAFVWALRSRQFSGAEQKSWSLEDAAESPAAPPAILPISAARARWMRATLATLAALMLGSILLILGTALHATGHPATGTCPFKF